MCMALQLRSHNFLIFQNPTEYTHSIIKQKKKKKKPDWGLLGLQPGKYRFKKHLNCFPLDYKMGEIYKGQKETKTLWGYINCVSRIRIIASKV